MKRILLFLISVLIFNVAVADKKNVLVIIGEDDYLTKKTLPYFYEEHLKEQFNFSYAISSNENRHYLNNLDEIEKADLVVLSIWRMALSEKQFNQIDNYIKSAKPLLVLKTSTHGFTLRPTHEVPANSKQWPGFDEEILGCKYDGHYSSAYSTDVTFDPKNKTSKLVSGLKGFNCRSWLYKVKPLADDANVLMWGKTNEGETQPVTWTRKNKFGGEVLVTTLGHSEDFLSKDFQEFFYRSIFCLLKEDIPKNQFEEKLFGSYLEANFPFYTTTLDARLKDNKFISNNLTSRALVLKPGLNYNVAFDPDLLRVALIWKGDGISNKSMAAGSYNLAYRSRKSKGGELHLPVAIGDTLLAMSPVPGLEMKDSTWKDPRKPLPWKQQISRGPLDTSIGRFEGLYETMTGPVLSYTFKNTKVKESWKSFQEESKDVLERKVKIDPRDEKVIFHLGQFLGEVIEGSSTKIRFKNEGVLTEVSLGSSHDVKLSYNKDKLDLIVEAGQAMTFSVFYNDRKVEIKTIKSYNSKHTFDIDHLPRKRWNDKIKVRSSKERASREKSFYVENIPLPYINSQHRNVRVSDIAFYEDGRAAVLTFDGDIWILSEAGKRDFYWTRFASGMHEPQGIVIRKEDIFVFDRQGITRVLDRDQNGEADFYENFCNLPIQNSETREFAMALELLPDGSFVISKGGQRGHSLNPHAGAVIKISPDGKKIKRLAHGLREPYIGVDSKTGDIFCSDQQGHWIPSTPFHHILPNSFYGFIPSIDPEGDRDFTSPTINIPHQVCQSGSGSMRVYSKQMGYFNNKVLYCDYSKSKLMLIDYDSSKPKQGMCYPLKGNIEFPVLKTEMNPKNGLVYLAGFQIWDSNAKKLSGLCRITPNKSIIRPSEITYFKEGLWVSFEKEIQSDSLNPELIKLERWNYLRSKKYGSGYFNLEGKVGKEVVGLSSVTLSKDKKSFFIAVPDMKDCMQMALKFAVMSTKQDSLDGEVYFTVSELESFKELSLFPEIDFNKKALQMANNEEKPSKKIGLELVSKLGCVGCHSQNDQRDGKNGPPWKGLLHSKKELKDGKVVHVDTNYLKESILNPLAKISKGYEAGMPPYAGIINDSQLESIIMYIKSLE